MVLACGSLPEPPFQFEPAFQAAPYFPCPSAFAAGGENIETGRVD